MRNVTITLEEHVVRWAKLKAAKEDTSVSRLVGEMLKEKMLTEEGYRAAQKQFFSLSPKELRRDQSALSSRSEVHDRADIR